MKNLFPRWTVALLIVTSAPLALADPFQQSIAPVLKEYCITCHSTTKKKGDLDLERFTSTDVVKHDPAVWEHALDQLRDNEMPPKGKPRPSAEQMKLLTGWMKETLDQIALASAGDPGPVVLRRLSNMEYTYTLRDLTGVELLNTAKEFPADSAASEGFTNAGAAMVMSSSMLTKYLDAAKDVANHMVLLPDGIRFSASTTSRDWTDESLAEIRNFYAQFSHQGGATSVNLQGVKFDTNAGGRLPVDNYVQALIAERDAIRSGKPIADAAHADGLNAKYMQTLWQAMNDSSASLVLDPIRQRFRAASSNDAPEITKMIQAWQQSLWRFASIGHIGKQNGPKAWQEPTSPLAAQHELRVKLVAPKDHSDIVLYLCAYDIGSGQSRGTVAWENARLVTKGAKDVLLRDLPGVLPAIMTAQAGSEIKVTIPAAQIKPSELVVTAKIDAASGADAAVQVEVLTSLPGKHAGLLPSVAESGMVSGAWSDNNLRTAYNAPILVGDASAARQRLEKSFDEFRSLFPIALCYTKIVPVDEVVTLTLFYREDHQLRRLMLDDRQAKELDRMWGDLRFVSEWPLKQVDVFEQLWQFATQDAKPEAFEPMREPILRDARAFKKLVLDSEPAHVQGVLQFAARAWRRPLTENEQAELLALYQNLRTKGLPHAAAVRMLLARVLVAPAFLYRGERAAAGPHAAAVNDWELATRLSYFLWSSTPDEELSKLAAAGKLHETAVLLDQARRMLKDNKVRRLATEFGCQWLHVRDLETLDEKSERHFPTFASLRGAMQEEVVRFYIDLFQEDRPVLSLLDADHSFMNRPLAKHYGIDLKNADWQRVDGLHAKGRGGILAFAATLAKQSGASRTSPILRGNWLSEVVLGEKLPRPPKGVPILPEEAPSGLTERQIIERHSTDATCAACHRRIDPFGFALEGFDAIGRSRDKDAAGLAIDTRATLHSGESFNGLTGLRSYLMTSRKDDFLRQFCRKLLGYSLGRSIQLSDKPLIESMVNRLKMNEYRVTTAVELIVSSPQFREVRGRDYTAGN